MTNVHRFLIALVFASVAPSGHARDSHVGIGSAIVPAFNIRAEALEPGAEVRILACVTNDNPHSRRDIVTGDSFSFTFGGGTILACEGVQVHSSDGTLADGEFACEVDGATVTIQRTGGTEPWAAGDQACALLRFLAPDRSASVRCAIDVANEGTYAPPMPHYLVLGIGDELSSIGPQGEQGPAGPQGPPGPQGESGPPGGSMAGSKEIWLSTGPASARSLFPPVGVPGLSGTITIADGSSVLVLLDMLTYGCPESDGLTRYFPRVLLEIDGEVVATRDYPIEDYNEAGVTDLDRLAFGLTWLTPPMTAGSHQFEVKIENRHDHPNNWTYCIGRATDDGRQARMIAIELR